jgi:hypothetical protein
MGGQEREALEGAWRKRCEARGEMKIVGFVSEQFADGFGAALAAPEEPSHADDDACPECGVAWLQWKVRAEQAEARLAAREEPRLTHGRHCPCSACAAEDWTRPGLSFCGMHGPTCPAIYAPISRAEVSS